MAKQQTNWTAIFTVVIIAVVFLIYTGKITIEQLDGGGINIDIDLGGTGTQSIPPPPEVIDDRVDMCQTFIDNFPAYVATRSGDCNAALGDFVCTPNEAGCIDIPVWNNRLECPRGEMVILDSYCDAFGGTWTCDAHNAVCAR